MIRYAPSRCACYELREMDRRQAQRWDEWRNTTQVEDGQNLCATDNILITCSAFPAGAFLPPQPPPKSEAVHEKPQIFLEDWEHQVRIVHDVYD